MFQSKYVALMSSTGTYNRGPKKLLYMAPSLVKTALKRISGVSKTSIENQSERTRTVGLGMGMKRKMTVKTRSRS